MLSYFFANTSVVTISAVKWSAFGNTLGVCAAAATGATLVTGGAVLPTSAFNRMTHANLGIAKISTDEWSALPETLRVGVAATPVGALQTRTAFHPIFNTCFLLYVNANTSVVTISTVERSAFEDTLSVRAAAATSAALIAGGAIFPILTFCGMVHANGRITKISTDERSALPETLRVGIAAAPVGTLQARTAFHPIANTFFFLYVNANTSVVTISTV